MPTPTVAMLLLAVVWTSASLGAEPPAPGREGPSPAGPGGAWEEATSLAEAGKLLPAARSFEAIVGRDLLNWQACWRAAESYYRFADETRGLPRRERSTYLSLAEDWADRGLRINGECGEGLEVLERVQGMPLEPGDAADLRNALILSTDPRLACGFSRDEWLEAPPEPAGSGS